MTRDRSFDDQLRAWLLAEAPDQLPDRVLVATFERTRRAGRRRRLLGWRTRSMLPRNQRLFVLGAATFALIVAGAILIPSGRVPTQPPTASPMTLGPTSAASTPSEPPSPAQSALSFTGQIAFERTVDGNTDIYLMGVDGSGLERLTDDPAEDWQPSWSPDGKILVFSRRTALEPNEASDIYVLNIETRALTRLTTAPGAEADPRFSPDGSQIAFDQWPGQAGLHVMNADGSGDRLVRPITSDSEGLIGWENDAALLTFDGPTRLNEVDISTGQLTTLREADDLHADGLSLSPDRTRFAFMSTAASGGLLVSDFDGSNRRYVTDSTTKGTVAWSADGLHLLFVNQPDTWWYIVGIDGKDLLRWAEGRYGAAWRPGS